MAVRRERDRVVIDPAREVHDRPPATIHIIDGHGKDQRGAYVWIGPRERGRVFCIIDRKRDMRALRDALNVALGE